MVGGRSHVMRNDKEIGAARTLPTTQLKAVEQQRGQMI
jgi:hypothetical protein